MKNGTDRGLWMKQNISCKLNVNCLILNAATSKYPYKCAAGWTGISRPTNVYRLMTYKAVCLLTSFKFDKMCPFPGIQHYVPITWGCDGNIWKIEARSSELLFLVVYWQCITLNRLQSATYQCSLLSALNDSALLRKSQPTFTSRVRVLQVRGCGGRDIPRVRCWQQRGSFIHTIGSHYISRSAQENNSSSSSSDEWWWAPSAALERGSETVSARQGQWRGGVKARKRGGWEIIAGRTGVLPSSCIHCQYCVLVYSFDLARCICSSSRGNICFLSWTEASKGGKVVLSIQGVFMFSNSRADLVLVHIT